MGGIKVSEYTKQHAIWAALILLVAALLCAVFMRYSVDLPIKMAEKGYCWQRGPLVAGVVPESGYYPCVKVPAESR